MTSRDDETSARSALFGSGEGAPVDWRGCFPEVVGHSRAMQRVLETVAKVARSDSAVMISGESGTGKELIANALHRLSARSTQRFVAINCSAIPENLLESELFGHTRGAFTGADTKRQGLFQVAQGGTIFLDEIGDMPLRLQAKLLRVLQERRFSPLGSHDEVHADVRVVAATNVDLSSAVDNKTFRLDLFFRLNVLPVAVPALRERREDIPLLLRHFLDLANRRQGDTRECHLEQDVIERLTAYPWPGNVRELANLIERLVILRGGGPIRLSDLPDEYTASHAGEPATPMRQAATIHAQAPTEIAGPPLGDAGFLPEQGLDLPQYIESLENSLIRQALERTGQNKNRAAKLLGLNRTTLVERIKKRRLVPLNPPSREL